MKIQINKPQLSPREWHQLDVYKDARNTATGVLLRYPSESRIPHIFIPGEAVAHRWSMALRAVPSSTDSDDASSPDALQIVTFTRHVRLQPRSCIDDPQQAKDFAVIDLTKLSPGESVDGLFILADNPLPDPHEILALAAERTSQG